MCVINSHYSVLISSNNICLTASCYCLFQWWAYRDNVAKCFIIFFLFLCLFPLFQSKSVSNVRVVNCPEWIYIYIYIHTYTHIYLSYVIFVVNVIHPALISQLFQLHASAVTNSICNIILYITASERYKAEAELTPTITFWPAFNFGNSDFFFFPDLLRSNNIWQLDKF